MVAPTSGRRRQRLQLDSLEMGGGHGFGDWWDRYHEQYPEIFALQPDGTRSGFPSPRNAKLCESNPKVWELWLKGVEEQLAEDPNRTVFNASPNDGWASGHCVCENCSAWDHPDGEPRMFHWKNRHEQRPALSDRDVTFANRLAELLRQRYPGQGLLRADDVLRPFAPRSDRRRDPRRMSSFRASPISWAEPDSSIAAPRAESPTASSSMPGEKSPRT